jgi:hypothetical protein
MDFSTAAFFAENAENCLCKYFGVNRDDFQERIRITANLYLEKIKSFSGQDTHQEAKKVLQYLSEPKNYLQMQLFTVDVYVAGFDDDMKATFFNKLDQESQASFPKELLQGKVDIEAPRAWKTVRNMFSSEKRKMTRSADNLREKILDNVLPYTF